MFKKTTDIIFLALLVYVVIWGGRAAVEAVRIYEVNSVTEKAGNGDVENQLRLARFYQLGWWHVPKDNTEAIEWYKKAEMNGSRSAKETLCNEYGIGCPNAENS